MPATQPGDLRFIVAKLCENGVGVLSEPGRRQDLLAAFTVDQNRAMNGGDLALGGMGLLGKRLHMVDLLILLQVRDRIRWRERHIEVEFVRGAEARAG